MAAQLFDWDALGIGDEEDPSVVKRRLEKIHQDILTVKGISTTPDKNSPGFNPTHHQAREVAVMSCLGIQPKDIALVLNVELPMLKLYYAKELSVSHSIANAMVARVALQMAASGNNSDMTKFWLKTQAGWRETSNIDLTSNGKTVGETGSAKTRLKTMLKDLGVKG